DVEVRVVDVVLVRFVLAVVLPEVGHLALEQFLLQLQREKGSEETRGFRQSKGHRQRRDRLRLIVNPVDPVEFRDILDLCLPWILQVAVDQELTALLRDGDDGAEAVELVEIVHTVLRVECHGPAELPFLALVEGSAAGALASALALILTGIPAAALSAAALPGARVDIFPQFLADVPVEAEQAV